MLRCWCRALFFKVGMMREARQESGKNGDEDELGMKGLAEL